MSYNNKKISHKYPMGICPCGRAFHKLIRIKKRIKKSEKSFKKEKEFELNEKINRKVAKQPFYYNYFGDYHDYQNLF